MTIVTRKRRPYMRLEPVASGKSFLIVTEGQSTEPRYLSALTKRLGLSAIRVVHPECTDPVGLTKAAISLRNERKRQAKSQGNVVAFDQTWVVFDIEGVDTARPGQAKQALDLARTNDIKFARSNPSFEYWLLLHYDFTTAGFANCAAVTGRLKQHWANYEKAAELPVGLIGQLPTALTHAGRCRAHHIACDGDGNPSTDVDVLVLELNQATRRHLRLKLD